ncbi:MAG: amidohydrolase family protein [Chitinophagales bacterium]
MIHLYKFFTLLLFFTATCLVAQDNSVPTPAKAQSQTIVLTGGTAHVGDENVINNSIIIFENGKITMVADMTMVKIDLTDKTVIDISGKHVYPGFVAASTAMGLMEIAAVRATNDDEEIGTLNPNVRSIISYNTDSRVIPTVRSNGVLIAQVRPKGGRISGTSSIVQLDAWNWEDAAYKLDDGIHLSWPHLYTFKGWWAEPGGIEKNEKYGEQITDIEDLFDQAKAYCQSEDHDEKNLKLTAMCGLFDGSKKLFVHVNMIKEIIEAVNFSKKYGVKMVIVGGEDAWMATDVLKNNNIPVVLKRTQSLPNRADEDIDLPFKLPKLLQDAGVLYCITIGDGSDAFWDQRNLPFHAGQAVANGLTQEQALAAITSNPAKILNIADKTGTLETGKDANIIVSSGDVLDMRTSNIEHAFIQGRAIDLDNKQKALYRKYMEKYGLEE